MCDAEMVPMSGQSMWGAALMDVGGEYADIAQLAHAHEEQCLQLMGQHMDDAPDGSWDE